VISIFCYNTRTKDLACALSCLVCRVTEGVNAMCLLWVEFVKALREQWAKGWLLPFMVSLAASCPINFVLEK
jgi:hypothetical protein